MKRHIVPVSLLVLALAALVMLMGVQPVAAHPAVLEAAAQATPGSRIEGDKTVAGENFTLRSGQTLDGNLSVWGGAATLERDSFVDGDVVVAGGSFKSTARVSGNLTVMGGDAELREGARVEGDATIFGGNLSLRSGSTVDGNVTTIGGNLDRANGARVGGNTSDMEWDPFQGNRDWTDWFPNDRQPSNPFAGLIEGALSVFGMTLLGIFVALIWPRGVVRVGETALAYPAVSLALGLLAGAAFVGLMIMAGVFSVLIITLCITVPVMIVAPFIFVAMCALGWIGLGVAVGERLVHAMGARDITPVVSALAGVFMLTALGSLPCIGFLIWFVGGCIGLGAVLLTRFGTQVYAGAPLSQVLSVSRTGTPGTAGPAAPFAPAAPRESRRPRP